MDEFKTEADVILWQIREIQRRHEEELRPYFERYARALPMPPMFARVDPQTGSIIAELKSGDVTLSANNTSVGNPT